MVQIVAEIGTSHEGSEEKAKELVLEAKNAGADAVKFQWVYADEILHPKTGFVKLPTGDIPLYDRFKSLECPFSFYQKMRDFTMSLGLDFICSPFGLRSLEELVSLKPKAVKIASPELNHYPLLKKLSELRASSGSEKLPVVLSSGVSTLCDIEKALSILEKEKVILLHCITSYPAPETEYNLKLIKNLSEIFGIPCGVSDHSLDPILVPVLSVYCGASMIEKHITLSRKTTGLDDPVALEGEQFALMVHTVRQTEALLNRYGKVKGRELLFSQLEESYPREKIFSVLGDGVKKLAESEKNNYGRTNRSIHYMRDMKKGEKVTPSDVSVLRTEKVLTPGLAPDFLETITGSVLTSDVKDGEGVLLEHFLVK